MGFPRQEYGVGCHTQAAQARQVHDVLQREGMLQRLGDQPTACEVRLHDRRRVPLDLQGRRVVNAEPPPPELSPFPPVDPDPERLCTLDMEYLFTAAPAKPSSLPWTRGISSPPPPFPSPTLNVEKLL